MATTITIDPVTRIEGHLEVEVTVDTVESQLQVIDAKSAGKMFRGFEMILIGRDPRDAGQYTQRICGVCPVSHAMASTMNLDNAFGVAVPDNGRILRNLVLGANFIQSHVLHFYHLSVVDFINTTGQLDLSPWIPRYVTADMGVYDDVAGSLVGNYVSALEFRRKAHQMGAIFGGKLPCTGSFVVGGMTEVVDAEKIADFRSLLTEIRTFIDDVYVPDALTVTDPARLPEYYSLGTGHANLLAFGAFDLDAAGTTKLFDRGRLTNGTPGTVDPALIAEYVTHSWYTPASGNLNPADGVTDPDPDKAGAYSWLKAPRYDGEPYELGPLARMSVNGEYTNGISVFDRIRARALEAQKIADAMDGWLDELVPGDPVYQSTTIPEQASGMGLTEAPRGALGHWIDIDNSVISRYQVVTPTAWNASPLDDAVPAVRGPIEEALIGTPVAETSQPVEVLRVVHSFDPCLACAVHMVRPDDRKGGHRVLIQPGIA